MRITYVTRSFLDYSVPVFAALDSLIGGNFYLIYSTKWTPVRTKNKVRSVLGGRAIVLEGEINIGTVDATAAGFANTAVSIPYQPGLYRAIVKTSPDVLVADGFFQWTVPAIAYRILKRIPLVVCYERTFHTERNSQWYRRVYRRTALKFVDAMCCNGKLCGEYTQSLGFPAENITYGHMVADTAGLQNSVAKVADAQLCELKTKRDLKGTVFLYVGRLTPRKGLIELLNAWKRFSGDISADKATLLLVGDGPQRGELEQYVKENYLDNVRLASFVDYDSLALYYKAADAFIIATLEDNWSLVVPEAMACGLPILCSKYNGCWPELVHHGENGWVFDPFDCKDVLQCLKVCIENRERLPQMGERSKVIVGDHTPVKAAESILRACKIAMARH